MYLYESRQTQRGFLGTIPQPMEFPKTKSCLVGVLPPLFLSIVFSLLEREGGEERETGGRGGEIIEERRNAEAAWRGFTKSG
jgi:hypothetical protein